MVVPPVLQKPFEGRTLIRLGVPPTSHVGDVLGTLLALYPRLAQYVADDRKPSQPSLQLFLSETASHGLARRSSGLYEGSRLYLSAVVPRRLGDAEG